MLQLVAETAVEATHDGVQRDTLLFRALKQGGGGGFMTQNRHNLKQNLNHNKAQSTPAESTNKGVN